MTKTATTERPQVALPASADVAMSPGSTIPTPERTTASVSASARLSLSPGRDRLNSGARRLRQSLAAALLWMVDRLLGPARARAGEAGMTTAEYAVGTIAACGFAAILYQVVTGDSIISALGGLISRALSTI